MAYERAGVALPAWGDAKTWYENAKKDGYSVGTTPKANSIAIWTKCDEDCAIYGHVGYLERVDSNGSLYIKDSSEAGMNGCPDYDDPTYKECIANGVSEETDRICAENAPRKTCAFTPLGDWRVPGFYTGDITQFIYLDDAPKTPPSNSNTEYINNNTNNSEKENNKANKKEETKDEKSSNTNLKTLKINDIDLEYKEDLNEYSIEVDYDTNEITIVAELEDELATIEGTGTQSIDIGENKIVLIVTAEDGTKKEINLLISRKEKEDIKDNKEESHEEKTSKNKTKSTYIILPLIVILLIIIVIVIIFIRKKNKKIQILKQK